jgi:hypothetical protein
MQIYRKQDGLTFEQEGHRYTLDGKPLISLTQILSAAGMIDYSHVDPQVLANKAAFGTKVHEYCLWNDQGELDMDDLKPYPKYWNRVEGWRQFRHDFQFTPDLEWCEIPAALKVNGMTYALTVDRFGVMGPVDGREGFKPAIAVIELKTCANGEPSHAIQTAGQALLFKGDGSVEIKRYGVYLLDKPNGGGKLYRAELHEDRMDEKIFLSALTLTYWRLNHGLLKG